MAESGLETTESKPHFSASAIVFAPAHARFEVGRKGAAVDASIPRRQLAANLDFSPNVC